MKCNIVITGFTKGSAGNWKDISSDYIKVVDLRVCSLILIAVRDMHINDGIGMYVDTTAAILMH